MKFSAALLLILALFAVSQCFTQRFKMMLGNFGRRPKPLSYEQAVSYFNGQWGRALVYVKRLQKEVANVCRHNYHILDDDQRRLCSCINIFAFMNEGGYAMEQASKVFKDIWSGVNGYGGPKEYCQTRHPMSARQVNDVCYCMTGDPSV